jgi:anaerobic selenocysteine-containing dehydrogenase
MGLAQHVMGAQNVQMVVHLVLLRGNIGKPGTNICAVRGHSNAQGQRMFGITEKPDLAPLDKLAELFHFDPPRWKGHTTVDACKAIVGGESRAFISLGGNFSRAAPETAAMRAAWRKLRLTVQIATKLNRRYVIQGGTAYLLPCLARLEIDTHASGPQAVSIESSVAHSMARVRKRTNLMIVTCIGSEQCGSDRGDIDDRMDGEEIALTHEDMASILGPPLQRPRSAAHP